MQVKFLQNLGRDDADTCNKAFGCRINHAECVIGEVVALDPNAAEYLGKKYPALFEVVESVKAVASKPAITAPLKSETKAEAK